MTTHTPGPWTYNRYTPTDFGVYAENGDSRDRALVRGDDEEAEANAHLIAAAPDLLEALEACQRFLDDAMDTPSIAMDGAAEDRIKDLLAETEAAIAKARGS